MKTFKELVEKIGVVPEYDDPISRMRKKENEEKRKKNVAEEVEQIDEIMDVASTYKKIAVQHLRDMSAKGATQRQKDYARAMNKRALEASKMSNHTDALNHYRGVKEEVEQIDEISQKLKQSYLDKSKEEVKQLKKHMKGEYGGIVKRMIARRNKGIKMASK